MEEKTIVYNELLKKKKRNMNKTVFLACMVIIPILHTLVFYVYVNLDSFFLAFKTPLTNEWTLNNFKMFWLDLTGSLGELNLAFRNTLKFYLLNFVMLFANFIVAFFFYKKILGYKAFRIIFYLPAIIAGVAMTTVFTEFVKSTGPLGVLLQTFDIVLKPGGLLAMPETALTTVMVYVVWTGFTTNVLLFSGTFARIPEEVLEAAKLDGCGFLRETFQIILPLVWPMFSTMLVLSTTAFMSCGGQVLLLTADQTATAKTTTLSYWMFSQVYGGGKAGGSGLYGTISAAGLSFSAILIPFTLFIKKITEKIPTVEY